MGFSRQEYWSGLPLPSPKIYIYIYIYIHKGKREYLEKWHSSVKVEGLIHNYVCKSSSNLTIGKISDIQSKLMVISEERGERGHLGEETKRYKPLGIK